MLPKFTPKVFFSFKYWKASIKAGKKPSVQCTKAHFDNFENPSSGKLNFRWDKQFASSVIEIRGIESNSGWKKKVKPAIRTFFPTLFAKVESKNEWKTFLSARCNAICFVTDRYINPLFHSRHFRLNSSWHFDGVLAMIISAPQMPTIRPKPPASPHMCVAYNCYVYLLMFYAVDVVDVASCQQTLARHKLNVSPTRNFR